MMKKHTLSLITICLSFISFSQLPTPAIVGYWESWNGEKFIDLKDIDYRYNVIHIAFASLEGGNDYELSYTPPGSYSESVFKSELADLQADGKKIIISIGGQNDQVMLDTELERDAFVTSVNSIIDYWGFDGFDIDLEGSSLNFSDINVQTIGDIRQQYLIDAIKSIMENHYLTHGKKLILTMAPETVYVQGALSTGSGTYGGAYLPMIEALNDSIDMLNVQLYNSGSMYGLDGPSGGAFKQGNADFVLAMTEAVILGYTGVGSIGTYSGIDASKVGVGLPGCHSSDAVPHKELEAAMKYLMGTGPQPGNYKLKTNGGYPTIKGMMTWSINSDRTCSPSYGFVSTWGKLFTDTSYIEIYSETDIYELAEQGGKIAVSLFHNKFVSPLEASRWTIENLPLGVTLDSLIRVNDSLVHIVLKGNSTTTYGSAICNVKVTVDSSQFAAYSLTLSSGDGVVLKKSRITIPGLLQAENLSAKTNAFMKSLFNSEPGLMVRFNSNYSTSYEIDVQKTGDYDLNIRVATSSGSHSVMLKIDGVIDSYHSFNSSTDWDVWDTTGFNTVKLDSGFHVLTVHMYTGWMHFDWIEFKELNPEGTMQNDNANNGAYLYPNPSTGIFKSNETLHNAKVYSLDGKLLKQWKSSANFDVSNLVAGSYLFTSDGFHTKIILK